MESHFKDIIKENEENKENKENKENDSILNKIISYLNDFKKRTKIFLKKNMYELSLLFIVIFTIIVIKSNKPKHKYCKLTGGLPNPQQAPQQAPQQQAAQQAAQQKAQQKAQQVAQQQQQQKQLQQQQLQEQQQQAKTQQQAMGIKSQVTTNVFNRLSGFISSSELMTKVVCYIGSFIKSIAIFGSIVVSVMLIPGVPIFGFMMALFIMLKMKMANFKTL